MFTNNFKISASTFAAITAATVLVGCGHGEKKDVCAKWDNDEQKCIEDTRLNKNCGWITDFRDSDVSGHCVSFCDSDKDCSGADTYCSDGTCKNPKWSVCIDFHNNEAACKAVGNCVFKFNDGDAQTSCTEITHDGTPEHL